MVTFTVGAGDTMRPIRQDRVLHFQEGAGQSFKPGAVVVLSGGQIVKGASDPAANTVVGVAAEAATGVQGTKHPVYMADEGAEFQARVQDTGVLALANVGTQYGIVFDAGRDIFRVDLSDTTNKVVTVTELIDAVGDVNGKVVFKFMNAARTPLWS